MEDERGRTMTTQGSRQIISFSHGDASFNFRAAAIIIDGDRVLLHHADFEAVWTLPGPRRDAGVCRDGGCAARC